MYGAPNPNPARVSQHVTTCCGQNPEQNAAMKPIQALHKPELAPLAAIVRAMQTLGPPTIEVVDLGDYYAALEGSHRLGAAKILGLTPTLVLRDADEYIDPTAYDWFDEAFFPEITIAAGVAAARLHWNPGPVYRFD